MFFLFKVKLQKGHVVRLGLDAIPLGVPEVTVWAALTGTGLSDDVTPAEHRASASGAVKVDSEVEAPGASGVKELSEILTSRIPSELKRSAASVSFNDLRSVILTDKGDQGSESALHVFKQQPPGVEGGVVFPPEEGPEDAAVNLRALHWCTCAMKFIFRIQVLEQ